MTPPARLACLAVLALVLLSSGCSRPFWRLNADYNTYGLLRQKTADPRWDPPRVDLEPDPRSRFMDPYDPDAEPLPPDDPTAHQWMHEVYGMRGWKGWHKFGDTLSVENPQWLEQFGLAPDQDGQPEYAIEDLTLEEAIELSYIHSRDFQFALEDLYQSALALTFERFRFNIRYLGFGGVRPGSDFSYESIPNGQNSVSETSSFGISRLFPTGAQAIVELTNNTLWLFTGSNKTSTASVLSYSLVQPLLAGGGRKVILENLTQAERNVLYAARTFARFRQQFFVNVVSGGGTSNGAYLGLLRQRQAVLNLQENIVSTEAAIDRLRALASRDPDNFGEFLEQLPEGLAQFPPAFQGQIRYNAVNQRLYWDGDMTEAQAEALLGLSADPAYQRVIRDLQFRSNSRTLTLDVAQLSTQLFNSRTNLLTSERLFQDALDRYKIQLGLPPSMVITLDEQMLRPFELIDRRITVLQRELIAFVEVWGQLTEFPTNQQMQDVLAELEGFVPKLEQDGFELVAEDFRQLEARWADRLASVPERDQLRVTIDIERDRQIFQGTRDDFQIRLTQLRELKEQSLNRDLTQEQRRDLGLDIGALRESFLRIAQGLSVVQIDVRVEMIQLNSFALTMEHAVQTGLENRLDLMNQRALVMDARRKEEVAANLLRSVLNVRVEGDVATLGVNVGNSNPLDFRGDASSFRAGVSFTAPLDQVSQRNTYRATLIAYQRARRAYMAYEDSVKFDVRTAWRQLDALRKSFENSRQAVRIAAIQLDQAVEKATAPLAANQQGQSNTGLNLLNALNAILNAENSLIQIWTDYETARLNIHRDMGIMLIDERGVWYDEYYQQRQDAPSGSPEPLPPTLPSTTVPPPTVPPSLATLDLTPEFTDALLLDTELTSDEPANDSQTPDSGQSSGPSGSAPAGTAGGAARVDGVRRRGLGHAQWKNVFRRAQPGQVSDGGGEARPAGDQGDGEGEPG